MRSVITSCSAALVVCLTHTVRGQRLVEPHPQPAVHAIITAFDRFPLVALGMSHELQEEARLVVEIVRDPRFARVANAIVVECGNSLYQPDMDRYVAGDSVPQQRVRLFWRNTTQPGLCDGPEVKELVEAVREVNRRLPREHQLRLLAGDPPIDWNRARTSADVAPFLGQRDSHFASVVERDVLAKHLKALLVIGAGHLLRHSPGPAGMRDQAAMVTQLIEQSHPHSVFVIVPHDGFTERNDELESRLATWRPPTLAAIDGTWLGRLDARLVFGGTVRFFGPSAPPDPFAGLTVQDLADGYLYLGPKASLHAVNAPPADSAYARELDRRRKFLGGFGPLPSRPTPRLTPPS